MSESERERFERLVSELLRENAGLRSALEQALEENERQRREIEELRGVGRRAESGQRGEDYGEEEKKEGTEKRKKRKKRKKKVGRKAGEGKFERRREPEDDERTTVEEVPVSESACPYCGGDLEREGTETASWTDMPEEPKPEVKKYQIEVRRCQKCQGIVRGRHPAVKPDQYGATAHRVGPRVKAAAHVLHYGMGVPVRKVPGILKELTGVSITQSAITQDALKEVRRNIGAYYQQLRASIKDRAMVYTDGTSWRIHGQAAQLAAFDTDQETVYQIRPQHRNEEVREVIPADYKGKMVTDRGKVYEAEELTGVAQQKCITHLLRNINEVLERQQGRARAFPTKLKRLLKRGLKLWHDQRDGKAVNFERKRERLNQQLTHHLRDRVLSNVDNQRLLNGIGYQHDRGRVLRFLYNPQIEPTNNRAERALRGAVIARKVSHCSKNDRGAEAFSAFITVIKTLTKRSAPLAVQALLNLPDSLNPPPNSS